MDIYRIWNKITHGQWEVEAVNIEKALSLTGCKKDDCYITMFVPDKWGGWWKGVK